MTKKLATPKFKQRLTAKEKLRPSKSLGQHFLKSAAVAAQIVAAAAPLAGRRVVEIGPGQGKLTLELLKSDAELVVAIEKDARMAPYLQQLTNHFGSRFQLLLADALTEQLPARTKTKIVANLPYNIAAALILGWLQSIDQYELLVLMVQKEMAARLAAPPCTKDYGSLSVLTQWLCDVKINFTLPPTAFSPAPKVFSSVITLQPKASPDPRADFASLSLVLRKCFHQRRKVLTKALQELFGDLTPLVQKKLNLAANARAEELPVATWCALTDLYRLSQLPDCRIS